MPFLENDLSDYLSLDGDWSFFLAGSAPILLPVPSAWESHVRDKRIDGPALYRRAFDLPAAWLDGRRILFEAGAISFDVTVRINGHEAGRHQGMWSRFQLDVTTLVRTGRNEIELEIWKPGPRFPLRDTLAGFLGDVCTTFGGPWQSLGLRALHTGITDLNLVEADRALVVSGYGGVPHSAVRAELYDAAGVLCRQAEIASDDHSRFSIRLPIALPADTFGAPGPTASRATPNPRRRVSGPRSSGFNRRASDDDDDEAHDPQRRVSGPRSSGFNRRASDYGEPSPVAIAATAFARWRPAAPALFTLVITLEQGGAVTARASRRLGLRRAHVRDGAMYLDDRPLHLRGVLDWGWHPDRICPAPSRETVTRQFEQARSLGFNLVKLCLFVPDETTFDVADEMGMMLWLELPLWLPRVTPALKQLALAEYTALLQRLHHHPSIVVVSLGCELNAESDPDFLQHLTGLAGVALPGVILCDNSGSAEAYGGALTALSDVYDYHFYTDPHFFQPLVDHFDRDYRPRKPWLYGEFCDVDTGRDFSRHSPLPWWLTDPIPLERDDYLVMREGPQRLAAAGIADSGRALTLIARRQATAIRKFIFEQTRLHDATGGYVISGWADTPITTSGIVDDHGELKFDPAEWRDFNADAVILIDRERRRRWVGGDRPAHRDPFCYWAGDQTEIHVLLSNGLGPLPPSRLHWSLTSPDGREWASSELEVSSLPAAQVREIGVLSIQLPGITALPQQRLPSPSGRPWPPERSGVGGGGGEGEILELALHLTLTAGPSLTLRNTWPLWVFPRPQLPRPLTLAGPLLYDSAFWRLDREFKPITLADAPPTTPFIADALTPGLLDHIRAGGRGLFWVRRPDSRFTRTLPFWREAIHVFEPHPLWDRVPQPGYADMRFFSLATDIALDLPSLQTILGPGARCRPIWRRFDARTLTWAEHIIEVEYGAGRLFVTGLRFEGGHGRQPETFDTNPMGAWMLASLLAELT